MKKWLFATIGLLILFFAASVSAKHDAPKLFLFYSDSCPHCAKEEIFIDKLEKKYETLEVNRIEVTSNPNTASQIKTITEKLGVEVSGVPFTLVGDKYVVGFLNDEVTGSEIENLVVDCIATNCPSIFDDENIVSGNMPESSNVPTTNALENKSKSIVLPVIGKIDIGTLSLPVVTFVIALLDGVNPCAMWVLLFLISVLLGVKNSAKRWIIGIIFLILSAFFYFIFMAAWLNFFVFFGYLTVIRYTIGLFAVGVGISFFIKSRQRESSCEVVDKSKRDILFARIKSVIAEKNIVFAFMGIAALAFSVNLIELACSAGLPAIYTNYLSQFEFNRTTYYLYLVFYTLIFLIDDIFVFVIAMVTLNAVGIEGRFAKTVKLIGSIVLILLGLALVFRPEFLSLSFN